MKIISFVVHEAVEHRILNKISEIEEIKGCFSYKVHGYFEGVGSNPFETQQDLVDGFTPRVRVDILVSKEVVSQVMYSILDCITCAKGRGVWYMRDIEDWGLM
jgi:nitrogen regulatory protein PII